MLKLLEWKWRKITCYMFRCYILLDFSKFLGTENGERKIRFFLFFFLMFGDRFWICYILNMFIIWGITHIFKKRQKISLFQKTSWVLNKPHRCSITSLGKLGPDWIRYLMRMGSGPWYHPKLPDLYFMGLAGRWWAEKLFEDEIKVVCVSQS